MGFTIEEGGGGGGTGDVTQAQLAAGLSTKANTTDLALKADKSEVQFRDTVDGENTKWGDKVILQNGHTLNIESVSGKQGRAIRIVPSESWADSGFSFNIVTSGTETLESPFPTPSSDGEIILRAVEVPSSGGSNIEVSSIAGITPEGLIDNAGVADLNILNWDAVSGKYKPSSKSIFKEWSQPDRGIVPGPVTSYEIYQGSNGEISHNLTCESIRRDRGLTGVPVAYVDPAATGAGNGESWDDAYTTCTAAFGAGARILYLSEGLHAPWSSNDVSGYDFAVIGQSLKTWIGFGGALSAWVNVATVGQEHLRSTTTNSLIATVVRRDKKDDEGAPQQLKQVNTSTECADTPESYFIPSTGNIVVHTSAPNEEIFPIAYSSSFQFRYMGSAGFTSGRKRYLENVTFLGAPLRFGGGNAGDQVTGVNMEVYFDNGSQVYNLIDLDGIPDFLFYRCCGGYSQKDVFNYHEATVDCNGSEVDCRGFHAGLSGAGSHQISSMHDGGGVVRVNSHYSDSNQIIVDTSLNTESWNIGCTFLRGSDGLIRSDDNANMNFINCTFGGNSTNPTLHANGGNITTKRSSSSSILEQGGGTVTVIDNDIA